jgi:FAD binding domain
VVGLVEDAIWRKWQHPELEPDDSVFQPYTDRLLHCGEGGSAGAMFALLLARRGVRFTLLETHHDFDREFGGDTVRPSMLESLDQLGLADRVHELRHSKISVPTLLTTRWRLVSTLCVRIGF